MASVSKVKALVYGAIVSLVLSGDHFVDSFQSKSLSTTRKLTSLNEYVPSGFTKESYRKFKDAEKKKAAKQNLGGVGPRGFKSRSMQSFQEAMERGEASHLMPVFNAKDRIRKGELKAEDIPYMQRGGSWDNSDVKGAKKKNWLKSDKDYSGGGFRREQSVSIFGYGEGLDWSGTKAKKGPGEAAVTAGKFKKGYKAPNVKNMKVKKDDDKPKKTFFGMF
uniref:Uncharacterized protein n=1 Tax=Attheya septentrionalis TaxID=420275 RepID=A0A7S2XNF5_9STRA|mmetsp:Transcript_24287/g.43918  ORF Transcript_24287/g.43918 Transcript_24287/m.43918 type:complete len:220 (+) Transcript_24287:64-723(+)|eukprot:CAMPEP_0198299670 /NCGR_PEP_ID=MMETSP1449-20131203/45587_1 /TAXON_ID=420275 /ORGANISM="Attheya septentrionalis, Strain CCMP2084" /LENGTH=219 /DNA_ID=CAMNT_0044001297 /DNA_START=20 /DNA_END=679 /DNA_ORIENTATION=-